MGDLPLQVNYTVGSVMGCSLIVTGAGMTG